MRARIPESSNIWMSTKRLETLVDGIFEIAMTLLVLTLTVPQIPYPATNAAILNSLSNMLHNFLPKLLVSSCWQYFGG